MTCQNCKTQFEIEPEDQAFYEKMAVPPPTFCWKCRFERRCAYRNEHNIFWNKSAKSGERLLSIYPVQSGVTVYRDTEWIGDGWDGLDHGRDYDFNRPFFEQFHELVQAVPHNARSNEPGSNVDSDYTANASHLKNCYLVFNSDQVENCAYGIAVNGSKECFDGVCLVRCELSYDNFWITACSRTYFSKQLKECTNVWFSNNCISCSDCVGCANLRGKKYYIFNVPYSREEYQAKFKEMRLDTWSGVQAAKLKAREFLLSQPVKYMNGWQNLNVTGEYATHSKNVHYGYLVREGENMRYCQYQMEPPSNKDCMDISVWGGGNELCYENVTCGWGAYNSKFCVECWPQGRNLEYSMFLRNCSDCFGCAGLKNKQYCIFNKQYAPEEYKELRAKIVQHMNDMPYIDKQGLVYKYGEFFPIEHSPFGHNTSIADEHFPLSKEEALRKGYPWDEPERGEHETTLHAADLPDAIGEASDGVLKEVIACEKCGRAYRIIKEELEFLKRFSIPLPRACFDCRHRERISQRNSYVLYPGACACRGAVSEGGKFKNKDLHFHGSEPCPNTFETSYSSERPEIVYCHECYQAEMI